MTYRSFHAWSLALAGPALLAGGLALPSTAEAQQRPVRVGVLTCNVAPAAGFIVGSRREMSCLFRPDGRGRREGYAGTFNRVGLDIGVTGRGVLAWSVFAPTRRLAPAQLAGNYSGASAQATFAVGLGANALVGGSQDTVALQPLSVQAQTGLNLALGIGTLSLRRASLR
jgi:hypothetical protein